MKTPLSAGRVKYIQNSGYQKGVLIGENWFEDTVRYHKETHKHNSIQRTDYTPQPKSYDVEAYTNNIVHGMGIDRSVLMDHEGDLYHENYSTTTDLCYNWFPKCKKVHRKYNTTALTYLPEQDFTSNYGNATNFGYREEKKRQWDYENSTGSRSWTTESRDNYTKPDPKYYPTDRKATPLVISSKALELNHILAHLPIRGRQINLVPDFELKVQKRKWPHFYY